MGKGFGNELTKGKRTRGVEGTMSESVSEWNDGERKGWKVTPRFISKHRNHRTYARTQAHKHSIIHKQHSYAQREVCSAEGGKETFGFVK